MSLQKNFAKSPKVKVTFVKSDGTIYGQDGTIDFVDVTIDEAMNTLKIKASFPNAKGELISGQYGRVILKSLEPLAEIVVPQRAIQQDMTGTYVYIISSDNKIERREVVRGEELPDFKVVVTQGLQAGDVLVTEGFQKIAPQVTVNPVFADETSISRSK